MNKAVFDYKMRRYQRLLDRLGLARMDYGVPGMKWGVHKAESPDDGRRGSSGGGAVDKPKRSGKIDPENKKIASETTAQLNRGIRNLFKRINEHKDKIENPKQYIPEWDSMRNTLRLGTVEFWKKEIERYETSLKRREKELERRTEDGEH